MVFHIFLKVTFFHKTLSKYTIKKSICIPLQVAFSKLGFHFINKCKKIIEIKKTLVRN